MKRLISLLCFFVITSSFICKNPNIIDKIRNSIKLITKVFDSNENEIGSPTNIETIKKNGFLNSDENLSKHSTPPHKEKTGNHNLNYFELDNEVYLQNRKHTY